MKTHLVFALILSGSILLAQNVPANISELNQIQNIYSFSLINSNLKATVLADQKFDHARKGDYIIVPLDSVKSRFERLLKESGERFVYVWTCRNGIDCIDAVVFDGAELRRGSTIAIDLGLDFDRAKRVAYLLNDLMESYNN